MAIYTNYGRYLKAKKFKESLEEYGSTYMLLGMGNPQWDVADSAQNMPIAPYNTSIINTGTISDNQFYDDAVCSHFNISGGGIETALENATINLSSYTGKYLNKCSNLNPPFPCAWNGNATINIGSTPILQSNYKNYFIKNEDGGYVLYGPNASNVLENKGDVSLPSEDSIERQYFSEMVLRGSALDLPGNIAPVGLLGAVKCSIQFVKDIGYTEENYTGDVSQFWYGDRYWEIVNPDEGDLDNYISDTDNTQKIYPHHLLFTATLNPRTLCATLNIDRFIVPRQISIFSKTRHSSDKVCYRADEYYFNFGQFHNGNKPVNNVLDFTLPCTEDGKEYSGGEFKFVLNDYIRGQVRDIHSVDRFGYVVSF